MAVPPRPKRSMRQIRKRAAPTKIQKFERLIASATSRRPAVDRLRSFIMPTPILDDINNGGALGNSRLERLPLEAIENLARYLRPTDITMLALTCKRLASVVEGLRTQVFIGNIAKYALSTRHPANKLLAKSPSGRWQKLGFPKRPTRYYPWVTPQQAAVIAQAKELRSAISQYLGPEYQYCTSCRKFRLRSKSFWLELFEHENPGITQPQSKALEIIEVLLRRWDRGRVVSCPVHGLVLEGLGGKRWLTA